MCDRPVLQGITWPTADPATCRRTHFARILPTPASEAGNHAESTEDVLGGNCCAYTTSGTREVMPVSGVTMTWRMRSSPVAFRVGAHQERASLLGSRTGGAFGSVGTHSVSAGMVSQFDWADWRLRAEAQVGRMSPEVRGGVWAGASGLRTGGFLISGTRRLGMNDWLTVSLSQPMRVEDGQLRLSVPVGRTQEGRVMRSAMDVDAEPSGRQLDLTVGWERMVSDTRGFLLEGTLRRQAGHRTDSSPQLLFTVGWRQRF